MRTTTRRTSAVPMVRSRRRANAPRTPRVANRTRWNPRKNSSRRTTAGASRRISPGTRGKVLAEVLSEADAAHEDGYDDDAGRERSRATRDDARRARRRRRARSAARVRTSGCVLDGSVRGTAFPARCTSPRTVSGTASTRARQRHAHHQAPLLRQARPGAAELRPEVFTTRVESNPERSRGTVRRGWGDARSRRGALHRARTSLKVVGRTYEPLEGDPVHLYEYTFNSNRFRLAPASGRRDGQAHRRRRGEVSYDLGRCASCRERRNDRRGVAPRRRAWVGGVYVVSGLLRPSSTVRSSDVKRRVGKLA